MPRRQPPPIPGLVEHRAPLAPGDAHVDPEAPHGRPRHDGPGFQWWTMRLGVFVWLAAGSAVIALWTAIDGGTWRPVGAAVLWTATAVLSWRTIDAYERTAGTTRDTWRAIGRLPLLLLVYLAGIPFVTP